MSIVQEFKQSISTVKDYIQQYEDGLVTALECRQSIIDKLNELSLEELVKDHERNMSE
jgi:transposase